jgi:hypothetical protein
MADQYNIPEINSPLLAAPARAAPAPTARSECVEEILAVINKKIDDRVAHWITQKGIKEWCEKKGITPSEAVEQICAAKTAAKTAVAELPEDVLRAMAADDYDDGWNPTGCLHNYKMKPPAGKKYYGYCGEGDYYYCPTHATLKANQATLKNILATVGFDVRSIRAGNSKARKAAAKKKSNESKVAASGGNPNVPQMRVTEDNGAAKSEPVKAVPKYVPFIVDDVEKLGYVMDEVTGLVGKRDPETDEIKIVGLYSRVTKETRGLTVAQKTMYQAQGFTMAVAR